MGSCLIEFMNHALTANFLVADEDFYSCRIDVYAASPDSSQDPAPVGIGACPCGLYKEGMRNRTSNAERLSVSSRLLNVEPDNMLYPFSVRHNLLSQRPANLQKCLRKLL